MREGGGMRKSGEDVAAGIETLEEARGVASGVCLCAELGFNRPDGPEGYLALDPVPCPQHPDVPRLRIVFAWEEGLAALAQQDPRSPPEGIPEAGTGTVARGPPQPLSVGDQNVTAKGMHNLQTPGGPSIADGTRSAEGGIPNNNIIPNQNSIDSPINARPQASEAAPRGSPPLSEAPEPSAAVLEVCPDCDHPASAHIGGNVRGRCGGMRKGLLYDMLCPCNGYRPPESSTAAEESQTQEPPSWKWNPNA